MALSARMSLATSTSHAGIIKMLANRYDESSNPTGFVNLAVAENTLMQHELITFVREHGCFHAASLTYGNGGGGSEQLRASIASFLTRHFHPVQPLDSTSVFCTSGMTNALEALAFALADESEAFLLARPYYGSFPYVLRDRPRVLTVDVGFGDMDPFELDSITAYETALKEAQANGIIVRGIVLCNPHNPLGRAYSKAVLEKLMSFAGKNRLHIISDEIYALSSWASSYCTRPPTPFTSILAVDTRDLIDPSYVHCLWGMSKDFGASGFRIAAVVSPHNTPMLTCLATRGLYTFPSGPTDAIVSLILNDQQFCNNYFAESSSRLSVAHDLVVACLKEHDISFAEPGGAAIFVWADLGTKLASIQREKSAAALDEAGIDKGHDQLTRVNSLFDSVNAEISARLIEHKVYLANGDAFASEKPGLFRIVFSHPRSFVEAGLKRMIEALHDDPPRVRLPVPPTACCLCV